MATEVKEPLAVGERLKSIVPVADIHIAQFVGTIDDAKHRRQQRMQFYESIMEPGIHYGNLPGSVKPCLYKPGAELLLTESGLAALLSDEYPPVFDLTGELHGGEPFIMYQRKCVVVARVNPSIVFAQASGACNSWEYKYRFRQSKRRCPNCGEETILRSKFVNEGEDRPGWYCNEKRGGCGMKFVATEKAILDQKHGPVKNPRIFDDINTFLKIADKRAFIAGALFATGTSELFTQDLEDRVNGESAKSAKEKESAAKAKAANREPKQDKYPSVDRLMILGGQLRQLGDEAGFVDMEGFFSFIEAHIDPEVKKQQKKLTPDQMRAAEKVLLEHIKAATPKTQEPPVEGRASEPEDDDDDAPDSNFPFVHDY